MIIRYVRFKTCGKKKKNYVKLCIFFPQNAFENMDNKKLSVLKELLVHNAMRDKPTNNSAEERDAQGKHRW